MRSGALLLLFLTQSRSEKYNIKFRAFLQKKGLLSIAGMMKWQFIVEVLVVAKKEPSLSVNNVQE